MNTPPQRRGPYYLWGLGRLRPGATIEHARAETNTIGLRVQQQNPLSNAGATYTEAPLSEWLVGDLSPVLLVLFGAVVFVLLIASTNVANLILARAVGREREIAIRAALGGGRGRILRQLLTESVLLALFSGVLGLPLGYWGLDALLALGPRDFPRLDEIRVDDRVFAFTVAVSFVTGILFGLGPALQGSRAELSEALKEGGRGSTGRQQKMRRGMIPVAIGLGIGVGGALALTRVLRTMLFGVGPTDPSTFVSASVLMVVAALVACYIPARRATRVDPIIALRYE